MNNYCQELKKLHHDIPGYGSGAIYELQKAYVGYRTILVETSKEEIYKSKTFPLRASSIDIDFYIKEASKSTKETERKVFFEKASIELKAGIKDLISILDA